MNDSSLEDLAASKNPNYPLSPSGFIDKINYDELKFLNVVGRGAFGTVQKAVWRGNIVAIKTIDSCSGVKEYQDEVEQLSRVRHKSIIRLFGTSTQATKVHIIMEYAEYGSLYNLLHPANPDEEEIPYKLSHVFRWSLQCAEAVEYLHSLTPKVIHRDLKPPNMLLRDQGNVIKICDFGTATQLHTEMTCNKGSASWMAPEVFEGKKYSEKCDVYSFGIVLWEMLSRKKPFEEIGPPAFRILWAVFNGTRPPLLQGMSHCLSNLMERCWTKDQSKRPSFTEIVKFFRIAYDLLGSYDEPVFAAYYSNDYTGGLDELSYTEDSNNDGFSSSVVSMKDSISSPQIEGERRRFSSEAELMSYSHQHSINVNPDSSPIQYPYNSMSPQSASSCGSNRTTPVSIIRRSPNVYSDVDVPPGFLPEMTASANLDYNLVPQSLLPIPPIESHPTSVQMYSNYMEALQKYVDVQKKILLMEEQKKILISNIEEVNEEQRNSASYLNKYLKLVSDRQNLLKLYENVKSSLKSSPVTTRLRSKTP